MAENDVKVTTDVQYDEANHLLLDVYEPAVAKAAIIDIHGGGWFRGDKAKDADIATMFAKDGFLVVVPNYREVPQATYPAANEDMNTVYEWLKASSYDFDHEKIGTFGSSAGGNMSIELAIKYGMPAASWSGIIEIDDWIAAHPDVVPALDRSQDFDGPSAKIDQGGANDSFYKWFILGYANNEPAALTGMSVLHRITKSAGPMFIANSLNELVPVEGVTRLALQLAKAGVPSMTQLVTGSEHAKGYLTEAYPQTLQFFKQYLLGENA